MSERFSKGGKTIIPVRGGLRGSGRALRRCPCPRCKAEPNYKFGGYSILPCNCHTIIMRCTCRINDVLCRGCGRVFVQTGNRWYEVHDPHKETESGR